MTPSYPNWEKFACEMHQVLSATRLNSRRDSFRHKTVIGALTDGVNEAVASAENVRSHATRLGVSQQQVQERISRLRPIVAKHADLPQDSDSLDMLISEQLKTVIAQVRLATKESSELRGQIDHPFLHLSVFSQDQRRTISEHLLLVYRALAESRATRQTYELLQKDEYLSLPPLHPQVLTFAKEFCQAVLTVDEFNGLITSHVFGYLVTDQSLQKAKRLISWEARRPSASASAPLGDRLMRTLAVPELRVDTLPIPDDFGLSLGDLERIPAQHDARVSDIKRTVGIAQWCLCSMAFLVFAAVGVAKDTDGSVFSTLFYLFGSGVLVLFLVYAPLASLSEWRISRVTEEETRLERYLWRKNKYETWQRFKLRRYWESLSGWEFEQAVASWFEGMGYQATRTKGSGDGGVDIVLSDGRGPVLCQCKNYQQPVGPGVVRELLGAMTHHGVARGLLVTMNGGSAGALSYAQSNGIRVCTIEELLVHKRKEVLC